MMGTGIGLLWNLLCEGFTESELYSPLLLVSLRAGCAEPGAAEPPRSWTWKNRLSHLVQDLAVFVGTRGYRVGGYSQTVNNS